MAKVLLINPMVREEDEPKHVPMGMAQLAAIAIKDGHQVQVYDHNAWRVDDKQIKEVLISDNWDLVALGGITTAYGSIKKNYKTDKKSTAQNNHFFRWWGSNFNSQRNYDLVARS